MAGYALSHYPLSNTGCNDANKLNANFIGISSAITALSGSLSSVSGSLSSVSGSISSISGTISSVSGTISSISGSVSSISGALSSLSGAVSAISFGSGTVSYHPKWATPTTLSDSIAYDDGTSMVIGGALKINTINAMTSTASVFLTHESNIVKSRTAAQTRLDLRRTITVVSSYPYTVLGTDDVVVCE